MTQKRCSFLLVVLFVAALALPLFAESVDGAGEHGRVPAVSHVSIGQRIANALRRSGLPDGATVFLISMLPIVELRGSIPVGFLFGMNPFLVFALSVAGNMVPIPFILLLLGPFSRFFMKYRLGRIFFEWLFARTRRKSGEIEKYETLGLTIFVAVPLPVTGGWTGAMAAFLMGMKFHHAMWSILLGVAIAGVIMTVLSLLGWIGAAIAGIALTAMVVGAMSRWLKKESVQQAASTDPS